ncbi:hypothetical protein, partial [Pseudomonas sp. RL]|uniref:hypothetical protein n=1 Tax=Pseudomonas sp. RL TaxID=1452718 RepID=UPI000483BF4D
MQQLDSPIFEPLGDAQVSSIVRCRTPEPLLLPNELQQLVDSGTIDRAAADAEARLRAEAEADSRDAELQVQAQEPEQLSSTTLLQACVSGLRGIAWRRQSHVRWPRLIEQAIRRVQLAALDPHCPTGLRLFSRETPLPGRARDGRGRDERKRQVYSDARANTANVLAVILGWADIASGLVAEKPRTGRAGDWKHKSWTDVGAMAFGFQDIEGCLCVEKRTARAVDRLEALGFIEVTQIREPTADRATWRSRTAVKRVTQQLWAALGLIKEFFSVLHARKRERAEQQKAARESA